jgi:hypothetical protein
LLALAGIECQHYAIKKSPSLASLQRIQNAGISLHSKDYLLISSGFILKDLNLFNHLHQFRHPSPKVDALSIYFVLLSSYNIIKSLINTLEILPFGNSFYQNEALEMGKTQIKPYSYTFALIFNIL